MIVEIIATGNEVVEGDVVNSNASWLALRAREQGWEVRFHTAVPDEESCIAAALRQAVGRAQIVLVTGGLGPTSDDLTLEIAARAFARPLQVDVPSLERIRGFFTRLGRKLTPNQEKQALIPQGSRVLPNEVGTAPGAYWREGGTHLAFFPGVPQEMKKMFTRHFLPQMAAWAGGKVQLAKTLHCFGLPEGELDHRLTPLLGEGRKLGEVLVGFRVRFPTLDLRLRAEAADAAGAQEKLAQAAASIRAALGEYVFGEDEVRLEEVVGRLLREKKQKLAVAESCTGGLLVDWMTDIPGASDYFLEGAVTYSNAAKVRQLGVSPGSLEKFGAVSREVALEMARGIRERSGADFGIGLTGIAGPAGGSPAKPVGTVHIALVSAAEEWEQKFFFPFDRQRFKQIAAATALDRLRRTLLRP